MNKFLTLFAGIALTAATVYGVPAKPGIRIITQPDGSTVRAELRGDEYCSFYVGEDGKPMNIDSDGYLRYLVAGSDGVLTFTADASRASDTQATYTALAARGAAERVRMHAVDPAAAAQTVRANVRAASSRDDLPQTGLGLMQRQNFPVMGQIKSVVILVSYKDVDFTVNDPHDYYTRHLNEEGFSDYNAVGSCRDFFVENSMGQFQPQFDLYGPVKLKYNRSYYGAQSGSSHDIRPSQMVTEACAALDGQVDFSQYDLDGDGLIDNIYIIYAGQGQASYGDEDTVWPHSSTIINGPVHDGVRVGRYACSNEWEYQRPDGIGTFVHEFSHVMGLPDLYETTYSTGSQTPGTWSTMDQGPYNGDGCVPPYYSAYERNALGWIDLTLIDGPATADLVHIGASNQAYLIPTIRDNEFFLLENRQRTGWDSKTPGRGLLVWHVDFDQTVFNQNRVNNDPNHQYVDIVECNGTKTEAGYPFPGTGFVKQREISPKKNPLNPWLGPTIQYTITGITEKVVSGEPNHVTFIVDGGVAALDAPVALEATEASATGFTANWQPVEGAASYNLVVYSETAGSVEPTTLTFGTATDKTVVLPDGWVFTGASNDVYTVASFAGSSIPSLKFGANGISLTSPLFEAEITGMSFFLRAGAVKEASAFLIEGRNDESEAWRSIEFIGDLTSINTKGATFEIEGIAEAHVRQARLTYYGASGKVGLDDLALTFGDSFRSVYQNGSVAETSKAVEVAQGGPVKFSYLVKALDSSNLPSSASNEVAVDLSRFSGIENIGAGSEWSVAVHGAAAVYTGTAGATVKAVNLAGMTVATATADAAGTAYLSLPSAGVYIVVAPEGSKKIVR